VTYSARDAAGYSVPVADPPFFNLLSNAFRTTGTAFLSDAVAEAMTAGGSTHLL
jgi:hypothetical protein